MTEEEVDKCICLEDIDYAVIDTVIKLKCGHSYHTKCVADWIIEHGTCPYCRKSDGFPRGTKLYGPTQSANYTQRIL